MEYKQITQAQLEIWLNDQTTKAYLQSLYFSHSQHEEMQGDGQLVDFHSAERTYGLMMENEGVKQGYLKAMNVIYELDQHDLLEAPAEGDEPLTMPDVKNIYAAE